MAHFEKLLLLFSSVVLTFGGEKFYDDDAIPVYTNEFFKAKIEKDPHFVLFYAPWCGHCQKVLPTWQQLGEHYDGSDDLKPNVKILQVNCVLNTELCANYNVLGYPTMKFFGVKGTEPVTFKGGRDIETFDEFIKKQMVPDAQEPLTPNPVVKTGLYELTEDTFQNHVQHGDHFIKFYAPWCGHCQRLAPTWAELATFHTENQDVKIGKVDCTENRAVCQKHSVRAYPTLLWFRNGIQYEKYQGVRDLNTLRDFIKQKVSEMAGSENEDAEKIPDSKTPAQENVVKLTGANFDASVASGVTFIKFYVDWCGHCKALAPIFEELGKAFQVSGSSVKIAEINCEDNANICEKFKVQGYPTIMLFRNGAQIDEYSGQRTLNGFTEYLSMQTLHDEL
ncbi:thioredoxin domain-containing protein 5-like [Lineus longissimus]|uniref:thioredoxin domain-containing protein 5-like n=1 Tax=Lineus longissimus TaxID=88925 RepID=UPI002B4CED0E